MATEAKLMARLGLDGSGFHKSLKEARTETRSFEKDMKFLGGVVEGGFAVMAIKAFGAAYKELVAYEKENGLQLISPDTQSHMDSMMDSLQEIKMGVIAVGVTWVDNVAKAIQATAAGLVSGFNAKIMAEAITPSGEGTIKTANEVAASQKKKEVSAAKVAQFGETDEKKQSRLKEDLRLKDEEIKKQGFLVGLHDKGLASEEDELQAVRDWNNLQAQKNDLLLPQLEINAKIAKKREEFQKEQDTFDEEETAKDEKERLAVQGDVFEEAAKKRKHEKKKADEEAKRQQIEGLEKGWAEQDTTKGIGFQHQRGGAYEGLVGRAGNREASIAERQIKVTERLLQVAERFARRDEIDKIRNNPVVAE